MANSKYDYHKEDEKLRDPTLLKGTYIIVRIDGDKFHRFCSEHQFLKPNDKRCLDLMINSAKSVIETYRNHIVMAYGHSDEFSFLIKSSSDLHSRRVYKIASMLPVVFATSFNRNWSKFFESNYLNLPSIQLKYDAWFDAKPFEYPNFQTVIDYFRWRQIDCHINNLYNTTLHALSGKYIRYEVDKDLQIKRLTPMSEWIDDTSKFHSVKNATNILCGTSSSQKHDIMYLDYKINYNNELEQFKKGTVLIDTRLKNNDMGGLEEFNVDLCKNKFWNDHKYIFDDPFEIVIEG